MFALSCDSGGGSSSTNDCNLFKGDANADASVSVLDIIIMTNHLLDETTLLCTIDPPIIDPPNNIEEFCEDGFANFHYYNLPAADCLDIEWNSDVYCNYRFEYNNEICSDTENENYIYIEEMCENWIANYEENYDNCLNNHIFDIDDDIFYYFMYWDEPISPPVCSESECLNAVDMNDDNEIGMLDMSLIVSLIMGNDDNVWISQGGELAENIIITHNVESNSILYNADGIVDIFYLKFSADESIDFEFNCGNSGMYTIENNLVTMYIMDNFNNLCNDLFNSTTDFTIIEAKVAVNGIYVNVTLE